MLAPSVLVWLALEHGLAGCLAMAVLFAATGAAIPAAVAWARRTSRAVPAAVPVTPQPLSA